MKKGLLSSVILSSIVAFSASAFASTPVKNKIEKQPAKVEHKLTKKVAVKPVTKIEKKAEVKTAKHK